MESYISVEKGQKGMRARPQTLIREITRMRIKTQVVISEATRVVTREPRGEGKATQVAHRATQEMEGAIRRKHEGVAEIKALGLNEGMFPSEFLYRRNRQIQRRTILHLMEAIQHQTLQHRLNRAKGELWDIILFLSMWKWLRDTRHLWEKNPYLTFFVKCVPMSSPPCIHVLSVYQLFIDWTTRNWVSMEGSLGLESVRGV